MSDPVDMSVDAPAADPVPELSTSMPADGASALSREPVPTDLTVSGQAAEVSAVGSSEEAVVNSMSAPPEPGPSKPAERRNFLDELEDRARKEHGLPPASDDMELDPPRPGADGDEEEEEEESSATESGSETDDEGGDEGDDTRGEEGEEGRGEEGTDDASLDIPPTTHTADGDTAMEGVAKVAGEEEKSGEGAAEDDDDKATTEGSDSEDAPKPKKQMPTIRLTIQLNPAGHGMVEKSLLLMAQQAGYDLPEDTAITLGASLFPEAEKAPSPPPVVDPNDPDSVPPKKKRRRRIQERDEGYDATDPFVDDSELQVTEPKFYHAPEKDGFYVASGPLTLKSSRKGRGRKVGSKNKHKVQIDGPVAAAVPASPMQPRPEATAGSPSGTRHEPITLDDDDRAGPSFAGVDAAATLGSTLASDRDAEREARKRAIWALTRHTPEKPKTEPLHPELIAAIEHLKAEVNAAIFEPKKFPQYLKPPTVAVAEKAIELLDYDDVRFFPALAEFFPYNTFTIKKLVKKEIFGARKEYYQDAIDERLVLLRQLIEEATPAAAAEYEKALGDWATAKAAWEARKLAKAVAEERQASTGGPAFGAPEPEPGAAEADDGDKEPKEPSKSFKFTARMKEVYYEILKLDDELSEVTKDTQKIVEKEVTHSEMTARKALYQRVVGLFPDGYMNTNRLSREMTAVKKKFEG